MNSGIIHFNVILKTSVIKNLFLTLALVVEVVLQRCQSSDSWFMENYLTGDVLWYLNMEYKVLFI